MLNSTAKAHRSPTSTGVSVLGVMPGLVPGIHVSLAQPDIKDVDGRDKPGHDGGAQVKAPTRAA